MTHTTLLYDPDGQPVRVSDTDTPSDILATAWRRLGELQYLTVGLSVHVVAEQDLAELRDGLGDLATELDALTGATLSADAEDTARVVATLREFVADITSEDLTPASWTLIGYTLAALSSDLGRIIIDTEGQ